MKLTKENIKDLAGESNRQTLAAIIASLLSMTLMIGVMGVGGIAVFALPAAQAFFTGLVCLFSIGAGGKGVADTYRLLYEGEWEPDEVKGPFNLQARLALFSFLVIISALIV